MGRVRLNLESVKRGGLYITGVPDLFHLRICLSIISLDYIFKIFGLMHFLSL